MTNPPERIAGPPLWSTALFGGIIFNSSPTDWPHGKMNKHITENITLKVIQDAMRVCNSIYSMNKEHAIGYLFMMDENKTQVFRGTFYSGSSWDRQEKDPAYWDGYIDLKSKTLTDIISNETVELTLLNQ